MRDAGVPGRREAPFLDCKRSPGGRRPGGLNSVLYGWKAGSLEKQEHAAREGAENTEGPYRNMPWRYGLRAAPKVPGRGFPV